MINRILERFYNIDPQEMMTEEQRNVLRYCTEIVQEVAKEYGKDTNVRSNGWIPCSERLPNIGERVLLWVYGQVHIGKRIDAKLFEEYDIFSLENKTNESTKRIEAWMPLPIAPYQKGE